MAMQYSINFRNAQFLANQVGCNKDQLTPMEQLACLQNIPAEEIVAGAMIGFAVNVDGQFAHSDAVVPTRIEDTILNGDYDDQIDLLIGSNTDEGLLMTYPAYLEPRLEVAIKYYDLSYYLIS